MGNRERQYYRMVMNGERTVDCYGGDSCEEHIPQWKIYAEGDMDEDTSTEPLVLKPENFPAGTRIIVECPVCPDCECDAGVCECGFNWKQWAEDKYA